MINKQMNHKKEEKKIDIKWNQHDPNNNYIKMNTNVYIDL